MPSYNEELQALLGVPSFGPLARNTERVAELIVKPSFHPECALRAELGRNGALLSARTVRRSFWSHWNVRRGGYGPNPVLDRLDPAVAAEEWILSGAAFSALRALLEPRASFRDELPNDPSDGLTAEVWLRDRKGEAEHWHLWIGEAVEACSSLVDGVLRLALDHAQGDLIRGNLAAAAQYFPSTGRPVDGSAAVSLPA